MDIMAIAAKMLGEKLGINQDLVVTGLQKLFGDGAGGLDLGAIVGLLQQGGLNNAVSSWLGDGDNQSIDSASLIDSLGADKVNDAAGSMGVSSDSLAGGLSDILPQLIDQSSSGGSLLDSVGGIGGVADMAKKFF